LIFGGQFEMVESGRKKEEYQNVGFSIGGFETSDFASAVLVS
jgi:hypothetical protein